MAKPPQDRSSEQRRAPRSSEGGRSPLSTDFVSHADDKILRYTKITKMMYAISFRVFRRIIGWIEIKRDIGEK